MSGTTVQYCDRTLHIPMFDIIQELYVFFTSSTKRFQPLKDQVGEVEKSLMLRNLSKTRWSARAESVQAVWTSFEAIVAVLQHIGGNPDIDKMTRTKASGLKKKMLDLDFIVHVHEKHHVQVQASR